MNSKQHKISNNSSLDKMKKELLGQLIIEKPNISWDSVMGVEEAKQALREAILVPKMFPDSGQSKNAWNGILLYGVSLKML